MRDRSCAPLARREALAMIERDELVRPAFGYRILPVIGSRGDALDVGGFTLLAPGFEAGSVRVTALAAAACTLGAALETRVSELFAARRPSLALALDAIGTAMLYRTSDRALAAIRRAARREGLAAGAQSGPGDPGIGLDQQAAVLAMACGEERGITLTSGGMLAPARSVSFVVALGPDIARRSASSARCARCPSRGRCRAK